MRLTRRLLRVLFRWLSAHVVNGRMGRLREIRRSQLGWQVMDAQRSFSSWSRDAGFSALAVIGRTGFYVSNVADC
jgi:hypothetical protein